MPEGEAIEHRWSRARSRTRSARSRQRNFDIRKQLLEYDDVANDQRKVIYQQRNELLESDDISETITRDAPGRAHDASASYVPAGERRGAVGRRRAEKPRSSRLPAASCRWRVAQGEPTRRRRHRCERVLEAADAATPPRSSWSAPKPAHHFERNVMLQTSTQHWREHLAALDHLRQGIHLRGYAQKNPKQEYKREAFELFESCCRRCATTSPSC
jgi:preprotein translocase subunit SecA